MNKWAKLTEEQKSLLGLSTYKGETILIDYTKTIDMKESFYYNAQEWFSEEELEMMPEFGPNVFLQHQKQQD